LEASQSLSQKEALKKTIQPFPFYLKIPDNPAVGRALLCLIGEMLVKK